VQLWAEVANVKFVQLHGDALEAAMIRIDVRPTEGGGTTIPPRPDETFAAESAGNISIDDDPLAPGPPGGGRWFFNLVQQLGHTLGLDYPTGGANGIPNYVEDDMQFTVMSNRGPFFWQGRFRR